MKYLKEKFDHIVIRSRDFFANEPLQSRIAVVCAIFAFIMLALCIRMIVLSLAPPFDF